MKEKSQLEPEEIPFKFRTYTKRELACLYSPTISRRCAIRIFTLWIKKNKPLYEQLVHTGYHPRTRTFTPRQVRMITDVLDIP